MDPFKHLKIRNKLLVSYVMAFILTVSLGSGMIYAIVRNTIETRIERELSNSTAMILNMIRTTAAVSIKNHLRTIAEKNREFVAYFYGLMADDRLTESQAKTLAEKALLSQTIGTTGYIYCINSKGIIQVHPRPSLLGANLSPYDFIRQQEKMKHGYIEYDWKNPDETEARPKALYMTYFAPWDWIISASSYRNEFQDLVHIDDFRESIQAMDFGKAGYAMVFDLSGKPVVGPNPLPPFLDLNDPGLRSFIDDIVREKQGKRILRKSPLSPSPHVMAIFDEIPNFNWIVACFIDLDEVYSPLRTIRNVMVAIVVLSLFMFLPLTLWISALITRPLQKLMARLDLGHHSPVPIPPRETKDEVRILVYYFEMFMNQLDASNREIHLQMKKREKAEEAIRESEKQYRELVQNANSIIFKVDPNGRILFINAYALDYFQYDPKKIIGKHLEGTIVSKEGGTSDTLMTLIRSTRPEATVHGNTIFEHRRENGEQVWVSWTSRAVLDRNANIKEYLCIGNDVTARIRMEEVMIQTEKMISVGGLAAGMAHEINNPLGVMIQNTQNIIRRLSPDLAKNDVAAQECGTDMATIRSYIMRREIDKFLEDIRTSGARASSIVDEMLAFSRKSDASKMAVDLAELLDKTIDLAAHDYDLKKKYDFRKIDIIREFEDNMAPFPCFPMEIQQVVLNLLRNAAQAMSPEGGPAPPEHRAARIIIRLKQEGKGVHIEVEDNGPGMDEAIGKRVFEPFFTTKPLGIGTGLGLSVSYFIVTNRHQGTLSVESTPGEGSRFRLDLPWAP